MNGSKQNCFSESPATDAAIGLASLKEIELCYWKQTMKMIPRMMNGSK
jgi:hypothetical protein